MANEVEIRITATDASAAGVASATRGVKTLGAETQTASTKVSGLTSTLRRVGEVAAGVLTANLVQGAARRVTQLVESTVKAASDLGESANAVNKVFGASANQVIEWGKANANAFGLSQRAFNQAATPMGAMLKNLGLSEAEAAEQTIKLTQRAADMGSVFNKDVGEALAAVQAGLRGETDPLEQFGVSLSAAKVEAQALADTGKTMASQLTATELATARLNLIFAQTASVAGDFQDTTDGLANSQRVATAQIEDAQAKIGTAFLPVMAKAAQLVGQLADGFSHLPGGVQVTVAAIAALAAGVILLVPRLLAVRDAMRTVGEDGEVTATKLGRVTLALSKFAGVLGVAVGAAQLLNTLSDVDVQVDALANSLDDFAKSGKANGELARLFGDNLQGLRDDAVSASFPLNKLQGSLEGNVPLLRQLNDALPGDSFTTATEKFKALDEVLAGMLKDGHAESARKAFFMIMQAANLTADEMEALVPHYQAALMAAAKTPDAMGPAAKSIDGVSKAADDAAAELDKLDKKFDEAYEKAFGLAEAQDALKDTVHDLKEQMKAQREEGVRGAGTFDRNTQAGRDNAAMARTLVKEYQAVAHEAISNGKSVDGLRGKLENQLRALGMSKDEAHKYATALDAITKAAAKVPKTITTTVRTIYVTSGTPPQGTAPRGTIVMSTNAHGGVVSGAASGGARNAQTMVGELGAEIVDLPYGSTVQTAQTSRAMRNGSANYAGAGANGGSGWGGELVLRSGGGAAADLVLALLREAVDVRGGDAQTVISTRLG